MKCYCCSPNEFLRQKYSALLSPLTKIFSLSLFSGHLNSSLSLSNVSHDKTTTFHFSFDPGLGKKKKKCGDGRNGVKSGREDFNQGNGAAWRSCGLAVVKGGQAVAEGKDDSGNGGTPLIDFHSLMGLCETMDSVWFLAKLIEQMEMLLRMLQLASRN